MNYIGIDIGDGETCVCVLPESSQIEPRALNITGRKSFLSAVARNDEGETVIGMDAVGFDAADGLSVRFKSRFLSDENGARKDMSAFIGELYRLLKRDGVLDEACQIAVGCPAGWDDRTREEYLVLIREAGFSSPRLVSESRGAFLYAKYAHSIQLDPALIGDSALVIDIGSSTLDFAYVVDGKETNVGTFGDVYLGGGAIDEALLEAAINQSSNKPAVREAFKNAPEWRNYCLLAARRVKEEFFTRQSRGEAKPLCREQVTIVYDQPLILQLKADEELIFRVIKLGIDALNGISFHSMLKNALKQASEQTRERPPKLVLMTGGASRMLFFQELCRQYFPDSQLVLCDEPELSIAKGLAYSARVDDNIYAFNKAIETYLKEDNIHDAVLGRMDMIIQKLSDYLADLGFQEAQDVFEEWRTGKISTPEKLNKALGDRLSALPAKDSTAAAMTDIVQEELTQICAILQPQIDAICNRYNISCGQMQLEGVETNHESKVSVEGVELSDVKTAIQILVASVVASVMFSIPGGQIIDLGVILITVLATMLGRDKIGSYTDKMELPVTLRKLVKTDRVINEKFRESIHRSFLTALKENGFAQDILLEVESGLKRHVQNMARRTEIAITSGRKRE